MSSGSPDPAALLARALESGRIHSAYLLSGTGTAAGGGPRGAALAFARGLVCSGAPGRRPCDECTDCRRSAEREPVALDGTGKRGPLYRHIGDHPDLFWLERGAEETRVRIGQVRALQNALRLGANEGGWRGAVIADAEWLNQEAQNALLRLLEEPPARTCLVLVTTSAAGLLATIRSRCQRVAFPAEERMPLRSGDQPEEVRALVERLDAIAELGVPELLDWAEEYRGARAAAAERTAQLLETGCAWIHERVCARLGRGAPAARAELDAFRALGRYRKELAQRNANPQMVAERALLGLRGAALAR
jgi:DNA polymerase III delta prime subunit